MEQIPSAWTNSSREIQDIRRILWNQTIQCYVHTGKQKCLYSEPGKYSLSVPALFR